MTYKAIIVKLAQEHNLQTWQAAAQYSYQYRHTLTASHDDTVGLLQNGSSDSYAKIVDPALSSQQATIQVLDQLGLKWQPLTLTTPFTFTHWPTQYKIVNQRFGVNPQIYNTYNLPGHEGVDCKANYGTEIYTVAAGTVSDIHTNTNDNHNYGIFVRVDHTDNWQTTYAHLESVNVYVGQTVTGGQLLGLADSTGNSTGSHLHLTLKNKAKSYTDANGVTWPYNIWNPEPFMAHFEGVYWPPLPVAAPTVGLHLRADPTGALSGEWEEVTTLASIDQPPIIKLLHNHPDVNFVDAATKLGNTATYVIRIFQAGWLDRTISPTDFVNWNIAELNSKIGILNSYGVPYKNIWVEIHNEPNLVQEGWNSYNWVNGVAFANWLQTVVTKLDLRLPAGVNLLYPGLSPGGGIADVRYDANNFFNECNPVFSYLDGIGIHAYWEAARNNMGAALDWVNWCCNKVNKPAFITECSIVDRPSVISVAERGKQYAAFAKQQHKNVKGITFFVGSASNPYFEPETWVSENNTVKGIAQGLAANL